MKKKNLEDIDKEGRTALHCAVEFRDMIFVEALWKAGAIIEAQRRLHGDTRLALACRHDKEDVAEFLIGQGARIEGACGLSATVVRTASTINKIFRATGGCSISKVEPKFEPKPVPEPFIADCEETATPLMHAKHLWKLQNHEAFDSKGY